MKMPSYFLLYVFAIVSFITISHTSPTSPNPTQQDVALQYTARCGPDYDYTPFTRDQNERGNAVIEMFRFAWNGYYTYAYPHDDYFPNNNSFADSRNGWGVLMFDALDTAIIMEQDDIVNIILDYVPTVDFTKNNAFGKYDARSTSLFETTIRYLGGMMGAYDLLKGPFKHLEISERKAEALLEQAMALADTLMFAFNTPTGIPVNDFYIDNQTFLLEDQLDDGSYFAGLAQLGTLCLEWQHLSDLSGDRSYGSLAQNAESYWFDAKEIWPGLTGSTFNISSGEIIDDYGGWTSGNDSAYEYLIKMYVYDPERYQNYSKRWQAAADSTIAHLISHPSSQPDLTMPGSFEGRKLMNYSDQLACFIGGNFILGSQVLGDTSYLDYGLKFAEFCANGNRYAASGIGPTYYSWNTSLLATKPYANQTALYERAGWFIGDNAGFDNGQRPEAVESWYYAYRVTGDQYWRDVAWAYTLAQNRTERVESGMPGVGGWQSVNDVLKTNGGGIDKQLPMESYMLAETLKYQYLIQKEGSDVWDVFGGKGGGNGFVYSTEGHPLRVAAKRLV